MKTSLYIPFLLLSIVFLLSACEEEFTPKYADDEPTVVVEAFTTYHPTNPTTYALISKTYSLFQSDGNEKLPEYYTGDAQVWVVDDGNEIALNKICSQSLDSAQQAQLKETLGIDFSFGDVDICGFFDLFNEVNPQIGKTYDLVVKIDDKTLTSTTTIPVTVPIDSIVFEEQASTPNYGRLNIFITDPVGPNYYRLKVSVNGGPFSSGFGSATDDLFFDGKTFDFPIGKPFVEGQEYDPNTVGLFSVGDTVNIQWSTIDEAHYNYWNTLEYAQSNQGPFSSYSRADSNIEGGIGIWGGFNTQIYTYIIE